MKAAQIMTTPVVTIRPDASINEAAQTLAAHSINTLPVTDDEGDLLAVVTETDVLRALALRLGIGLSPTARLDDAHTPRRVADIAHPARTSVHVSDEMSYCLALMVRNGTKGLPVLDGRRVVGIISRREALRALDQLDLAAVRDLVREGRLPGEPSVVTAR